MDNLSKRLETFAEWPPRVPVKPKVLAEAGFYYVGCDDTVCCFACGGILNGWDAGDIPEDIHRRRFGDNCTFIRSREADEARFNVEYNEFHETVHLQYDPIGNEDMEYEQQRLRSFNRNNGWSGAISPIKLASAGFYFTGVDDNVKCFACDLSLRRWEAEDDPITEHLKYQPTCPFLIEMSHERLHKHRKDSKEMVTIVGNEIRLSHKVPPSSLPEVTSGTTSQVTTSHQVGGTFNATYQRKPEPVRQTANYANEHARLHSFINWPKECPVQPKELIDAGFYYTGEADQTQCFKCGITLAGWEPEDTPWGEHEKWAGNCPLVQERLLRRNPHGANLVSGVASILPKEQKERVPKENTIGYKLPSQSMFMPKPDFEERRPPSEHVEISPGYKKHDNVTATFFGKETAQGETALGKNGKKGVFYLQKAVQELVERGYNYGKIQETIQYKTKVCKESINSLEELLDAHVLFMEGEIKDGETDTTTDEAPTSPVTTEGFSLSVDAEALHRQVEKMQEAHTCKVCLDAEIGVLFLPCGHLVCCPTCATEIQSKVPPICPVCRKQIQNTVRTYLP